MKHLKNPVTRRTFLKGTLASFTTVSIVPGYVLGLNGAKSPNEKMNLAFIGVGGRGAANLQALGGENVVALCDVDWQRATASFEKHPGAKQYRDYRKMLDQLEKQLDGVVVSTPDHTHAVAAMAVMKRGKNLYCEKPLAHSVGEIRTLMKAAREHKVMTQLGNQGHSFPTIHTFRSWIEAGAIGKVHTIHAGCGSNGYTRIDSLPLLAEKHPVPETLDWDWWLGPAQYRPYHPLYLPGKWRAWMPFGSGAIGDWFCHVVDPVFWALDLGSPTTIQASTKDYDPVKHADTFPKGTIITYEFPAKGRRGPVKLLWFDGTEKIPQPADLEADEKVPGTGAVVMGDQGTIIYGSHGAANLRIVPEAKMEAYRNAPKPAWETKAHHEDWLNAIRTGKPAGSNFDYGGALSELAMLGIIAMRMPDTKLEWDGAKMAFRNNAQANAMLMPKYREGWSL
ncbi:MAG TPA: Gfo/Idh/MocA family oxidoreductase [Candidatus Sulfotelmatobacter sp.]|nr:Gfo/Idh/MocA family oxidoreductase [Candidatus Sulfotelmatobacter sp.]